MRPILPSERDRKRQAFRTSRPQVLVEIHGDRDDAVENADIGGFIVSSGEQGKRKLREAHARFWLNEEDDSETQFGNLMTSAARWTFRFVEPEPLDIRGDDEIHVQGRIFQVTNPGGETSSSIQRDVETIEII